MFFFVSNFKGSKYSALSINKKYILKGLHTYTSDENTENN